MDSISAVVMDHDNDKEHAFARDARANIASSGQSVDSSCSISIVGTTYTSKSIKSIALAFLVVVSTSNRN